MKLLIVEDDLNLREQLAQRLRQHNYTVEVCDNGEDALFTGREYAFDAAIVDLGLPGIGGMEVIRGWRKAQRSFPVLILTARGHWQDKVEGLEAGADDYLVKPFQPEELLARINALIRRSTGHASASLKIGPIELDTSRCSVSVHGEQVKLTSYEYRTLEYLMLHAGKTVSKMELTEHLYEQDFDRDSNVLEVFIRRLRQKLDPEQRLQPIQTLRGLGYRFDPELKASAED